MQPIQPLRRLRRWRPGWWPDRWIVLVAVAAAYGPVIASSPGQVGADTKTYLYLDPGRLLGAAPSLWDADRALGTVTHQTIGYLWPMGPFYWFFEVLGCPDWLAQRLWLGSLLVGAGLGVRYLMRTLGWEGRGLLIAMLAYELSPYLLHYSARISTVLAPWAALGWLIALTVKSARVGGWRYPALFALVAVTAGSVNATSGVLVGLAPVLWLVHAALVERSVTVRGAGAVAGRIGVLTVGVSLWWITGLFVQGAYSLAVTRYTETYKAVADASTAPEILRGLGYWFFYGNDKLGPWIEPSVDYTQGLWLVFVSFGLVVGTLGLASAVRWRYHSYFLILLALGALVGVGAHPWDSPSAAGGLFKAFTRTDAGLAMRSTPRAVPLVALSVAVLAGAGVGALHRKMPRFGSLVGAGVLVAVVLNNPAMWKVRMVEEHLHRPEEIPSYWLEAAADLDDPALGRVWEIPGSDFASYRWGNTVDPITPGLIDRGYVARELVPFGSAQSAALLGAVDRRLQEDTLEVESLAPVARLMSVSDIVHRADLIYERFRTPRPVETADLLNRAPGLVEVAVYGDPVPNVAGPEQTLIDETHLARPAAVDHPGPVTRFEVVSELPELRVRSGAGAVVVAGDADGIVDSAAAGVLDSGGDRPLFFAADLLDDDELLELVMSSPADIVVTDSNRRRAHRWGTLRENRGHTEMVGEVPLAYDPTDNRLEVFSADSGEADDTRTVSEQRGSITVQATAYGNPVTYTTDDRPVHAVDGSLDTAWVVAAFSDPRGEFLQLRMTEPTAVPTIRLVQPLRPANRHITEVEIRADGALVATAVLDERSLTAEGQAVTLGVTASVIEIEITGTDSGRRPTYAGVDPVGFAEVDIGAGPVTEVIRVPRALLDRLGDDLTGHGVTVVLTRERSNPREPVRSDPEPRMVRALVVPIEREVLVRGTARLSAYAPSSVIDELLGLSARAVSGSAVVRATSSGRLPGDLASRASAVLDGDPLTAWTGVFGSQAGQWIEVGFSDPPATDRIDVDVVVDRLHSVPTALQVLVDGIDTGTFRTGLVLSDRPLDSLVTVTLPLDASGKTIRLVAEQVSERLTRDWYSNTFQALPISIAEVRFGAGTKDTAGSGADASELGPASPIDTGCRDDLVSLNDRPVPVRITGSVSNAEARHRLDLNGCEPVVLAAGETLVVTTPGASTGIDVDQVVLSSPSPAPASATDVGHVHTSVRHRDTHFSAQVTGSQTGRWLVLGQSYNRGWHATADGSDLGEPMVIDGFANGWYLPAGPGTSVDLRWRPQRLVNLALGLSAIFGVLVMALAWRGRRVPVAPQPDAGSDLGPACPELIWPYWKADARVAAGRAGIGAGLVVAAVAAVTLPHWPSGLGLAPLLGGATMLAARWRRGAGMLVGGAAVSMAATAAWVMVEQRRFRHPPDFDWPQRFGEVHVLGVLTILLVLAGYARAVAVSRTDPGRDRPEGKL